MNTKCWICGTVFKTECPKCGPPETWGPTPGELLLEAQKLYDDYDEDEDEHIEEIAADYEGDDTYARDVCVKRWGPL